MLWLRLRILFSCNFTMKHHLFVFVNCVIVSALQLDHAKNARILNYKSKNAGDGHYYFSFESSDGISREEEGHLIENVSDSPVVVKGSYSYTDADGQIHTVKYIADEKGFRPVDHYIKRQPLRIIANPNLVNGPKIRPSNLFSGTTLPVSSTAPFSSTTSRPKAAALTRIKIPLERSSVTDTKNDDLPSIDLIAKNTLGGLLSSDYVSTNRPELIKKNNQFSTTVSPPLSSRVSLSTTATPNTDVFSTVQVSSKTSTPSDKKLDKSHSLDVNVKNSIDSLLGAGLSVSEAVNSL